MCKEKGMERLLPKVKKTVDSVYEYLIPHPDGCGMSAKDYGRRGARVVSLLVKRNIIEKTNLGRGEYKYRWIATMSPTPTLYRSITLEIQTEEREYYAKSKKKKSTEAQAPANKPDKTYPLSVVADLSESTPEPPVVHVVNELFEKPSGIYWHAIKQGERLPCRAYLWNLNYEKYHDCWEGRLVPNLENVSVGEDTWYLPADDLRALPREGVDELRVEQKAKGPVEQVREMWERMQALGVIIENNQLVLVSKTVLS